MTVLNCPDCGGIHYGSVKCPYIVLPCVICGDATILACSDCAIESKGENKVHVCKKPDCQRSHEREYHPQSDGGESATGNASRATPDGPEGGEG